MIRVIGEIKEFTLADYFDQIDENSFNSVVLISSPGGDIGYTLAMLDDIDQNKRNTYATGICQSAAAVLATAGEGKRTCTMDTLFRFMPPELEKMKDPNTGEEIEKVPDLRYFLHSILVARLAGRLKVPVADAALHFDGEFITSLRAKELGLIDEVIGESDGQLNRVSGCETGARWPIREDE